MKKQMILPLDIKIKKNGIITDPDEYLILPTKKLILDNEKLCEHKKMIELFLQGEHKMKNKSFAEKVLLANEIQSNNMVENYYDDINDVKKELTSKTPINKMKNKELRILNLYNGYKFILDSPEINKENLCQLYKVLSYNLLSANDLSCMGDFYRNDGVEIDTTGILSKDTLKCMPCYLVDEHMNKLFSFINGNFNSECITDEYIKSQIIHFYFVYIHPYFDINGRTSRTTSLWYLLNKEAYPFVIFNRGININKSEYYKVIMDVRKFANISFFVDYMLKTVLIEMQKEYVMQTIGNEINDLTDLDYQTLHYLLSINGNLSLCDFANAYNKHNNNKKNINLIYHQMIEPLLEKGIIIKTKETNKRLNNMHNFMITFNTKYIDDNPVKTGKLKIIKNS